MEMHSLAHFNMCVAFDGENEIQFVLLTGKILHRVSRVQRELCYLVKGIWIYEENIFEGFKSRSCCRVYRSELMQYLHHHLFFILWIRTGLQNPYGYGNSHVCLRGLVAKSV